jgi:hypothetical chaperone protein
MFCGLDFGTSNTAIAVAAGNGVALAPVENGERTLPSAIFFDDETRAVSIGRAGVGEYLAGQPGRLMRGLKSVLGSSLMEETTQVAGQRLAFEDIIAAFVGRAKARAEAHAGHALTRVVHGRPVRFTHDEAADRRAEAELEAIARKVGFEEISFQFEPIAAALTFETTLERETLALIADIGGGTSDFSLVRLGPARAPLADRAGDVLANEGLRLGGTDLDTALSLARVMPAFGYEGTLQGGRLRTPNYLYVNLATWSRINETYAPDAKREVRRLLPQADAPETLARMVEVMEHRHGHRIAGVVEEAKIALSDAPATSVGLGFVEPGLAVPVARGELETAIAEGMDRLSSVLRECVIMAGVAPSRVGAVVMTGGSTLLPAVRRAITRALPDAAVFDCDQFGAVATGLGLEAMRRYR